jgi:glycosyltransferase involved in cell wall biosynthesis
MIRVMHLCAVEAEYEARCGITALAGDTSGTFNCDVRAIGRGGTYSNGWAAVLHLRHPGRRDVEASSDLIHAWGMTSLTVAAFGTRVAIPIVFSPTDFPRPREVRWLRAIMGHRDVNVVCPTDTIRRRFVERGVPIERCHLLRPGVAFGKVKRRRDPALREALGLKPDDRVILAPGESTRAAAHGDALLAATILNVMDRSNHLLVWGRGPLAESVRRFARRTKQPTLIDATVTLKRQVAFEGLLPAVDEVLVTAAAPVSTLPIAICMAAGLPIVATVTPTVAELLEDRHTALMVGESSPRVIAQRILDLRSDSSLQWSTSDMARTEAYEFFAQTRFLQQFREVYQQVAARQPVNVPQQAPGAGLRFHGRG